MPYLANLDEFGNTALEPGPVFSADPISQAVQAPLAQLGLFPKLSNDYLGAGFI